MRTFIRLPNLREENLEASQKIAIKLHACFFFNCSHFNFYSNPINFWNVRISEKKRKKKAFRSKTERKKIASKLNA